MIQSAAPSITSSLALNTGTQAAQGDDAAVSGDFAALLTASIAGRDDKPIDPAATPDLAVALQLRQQPGKFSGKELPLALPELDAPLAAAADSAEAGAPTVGDKPVTPSLETILPGLALSLRSPRAPKAAVKDAPLASLIKAAMSHQSPAGPTEEAGSPTEPKTDVDADTDESVDTATVTVVSDTAPTIFPLIQPAATAVPRHVKPAADTAPPVSNKPAPVLTIAQTPAQAAPKAPADQSAIARATPPAPAVTATSAEAAAIPASLAVPQADTGTPDPTTPTATLTVPTRSSGAAPDTQANRQSNIPAGPQLQMMAAASAVQPAKPKSEAVTPIIATPADDTAPKAPFAVAAVTTVQDAQTADQKGKSSGSTAPADAFAPQTLPLAAAAPQPIQAQGDVQTFAKSIDPVAPTATAMPLRQAGHDFTNIVDRLVEAREAAMPQAVGATISHSEFGQVSLRFDQDANGLSVAMSSADPDFARAVQASAASAQSQTASDNGSNAPRQDTSAQQQAAGSPSGQPQSNSHANSQASARNDRSATAQTDNRSGSPSGEQGQDDESADARSGIYA